jgi:hypothetical protein
MVITTSGDPTRGHSSSLCRKNIAMYVYGSMDIKGIIKQLINMAVNHFGRPDKYSYGHRQKSC